MADTTRAARVHAPGPASAFVVEDVPLPPPAAGEVRVRHTAIGVNFIDVYQRSGAYAVPLPAILGTEAVGVAESEGPGVKVGDRVAYYERGLGAYCDRRNIAAARVLHVPSGVDDVSLAAVLVKGLTAEYLLRRTFRLESGHTVVVHAAAGGVGLVLVQWARAIGAKVIGVVSSEEKAAIALGAGAQHVLATKGSSAPLGKRVRDLAPSGVDVVYDSVGKDTFLESLDMLRPRGMCVLFGQASGPVAPISPGLLAQKGSLFLTRPALHDYVHDVGEYKAAADVLFDALKRGAIKPRVHESVPLAEVGRAHALLESRTTTGALVLVP
jgi:NADPH2:quinone reductase